MTVFLVWYEDFEDCVSDQCSSGVPVKSLKALFAHRMNAEAFVHSQQRLLSDLSIEEVEVR